MKFAVAKEHRSYFRRHQHLELELLSSAQLDQLLQGIRHALSEKLDLYPDQTLHQTPSLLFRNGRDLWRSRDAVKKTTASTGIAEIFSELAEKKRVRLGYDQYFPARSVEDADSYGKFLQKTKTLAEISCIQGVLGGVMLCLDGEETEAESTLFSTVPGNGVFFDADLPIEFSKMPERHSYLLIVYADKNSVYISNREDPIVHSLMKQGYNYGDRLNDKENPILIL